MSTLWKWKSDHGTSRHSGSFGEGIKAVCVLNPGARLSERELIDFVTGRIARYKKPGYVEFVDSLPKKEDGSIDRQRVKAQYGLPTHTDSRL
jgi:acyl-CoA synthetase (AMP-forming)/AMP-acid ligase II